MATTKRRATAKRAATTAPKKATAATKPTPKKAATKKATTKKAGAKQTTAKKAAATSKTPEVAEKFARLSRPIYEMPAYIEEALVARGLMKAYRDRPVFQQNDYIGWIERAKRPATRDKRLDQMLEELEGGRLYMNMAWRPLSRR